MKKDTKVTIHLVSEDFDMIIEDCFISGNREVKIPFSITKLGNYYFRMYPHEPVQINRLAVITVENI